MSGDSISGGKESRRLILCTTIATEGITHDVPFVKGRQWYHHGVLFSQYSTFNSVLKCSSGTLFRIIKICPSRLIKRNKKKNLSSR